MFPTDLELTDAEPVTVTYSQISLENGKSIRKDADRDLGTPRTATIAHTTNGKGMSAVDRHLFRLDLVEEDTGSQDIATVSGSVYLVIEAPRRIVTDVMIEDMVTQLVNFFGVGANVTKILNSEP